MLCPFTLGSIFEYAYSGMAWRDSEIEVAATRWPETQYTLHRYFFPIP